MSTYPPQVLTGWPPSRRSGQRPAVTQDQGWHTSPTGRAAVPSLLALYSGDPLNYDVRVVEDRGGYRGVSLAYVVDTPERVDELVTRVKRAGATILQPAHSADWGGYLGYFTDPDGNFWKIVFGQTPLIDQPSPLNNELSPITRPWLTAEPHAPFIH